ncbi:hypothetical protein CIPAW_07G148900 [Carya illinoinensis]|uniref:Uncharacterized protein n=1 Tax=Carya illinoinensis TaxID=32201 RepID=A0A8T1Q575_CARIL|nr:hypothetical protein CIPAW_07G148900 [Carya illinoinensis]
MEKDLCRECIEVIESKWNGVEVKSRRRKRKRDCEV